MKNSILSKNIRKLRAFKNLNQTDFAELFGIKRASIGAYEEGRAEPKLDTLIKIITFFKLSLDDLIIKELTVNQIAKFDKAYNRANNHTSNGIEKEIKALKLKIDSLENKIDKIVDKM
jgi:DNA-binding XRE family transcriptional regulator